MAAYPQNLSNILPIKALIKKAFSILNTLFFGLRKLYSNGWPKDILYCYGGLGDELNLTIIVKAYYARYKTQVNLFTRKPEIFKGNPYVKGVVEFREHGQWSLWFGLLNKFRKRELKVYHVHYNHQPAENWPAGAPRKHMITMMANSAGITDADLQELSIEYKADLHQMTDDADTHITPLKNFILIHSTSSSAPFYNSLKEWTMFTNDNRFVSFCTSYGSTITDDYCPIIQIGSPDDPQLPHTIDLRGKTSLATLAYLCSKASLFIGLEGGVMHMARAFNLPSVILYGGHTMPAETGYATNTNLYSPVECSPCWKTSSCPYHQYCMTMITEAMLFETVKEKLSYLKQVEL